MNETVGRRIRVLPAVLGVAQLVPGVELAYAGVFGRGGGFALLLAGGFIAAAVLLISTARAESSREAELRTARRVLLLAAGASTVGYCGLRLGMVLYPQSNLLGGLALIFGPIYWLGSLVLFGATITCVVQGRRPAPLF